MYLTKTELKILTEISKGNNIIINIAKAIKKSEKQIYVSRKKLYLKKIINQNGPIISTKVTHISLLLQLLSNYNLTNELSGHGIKILKSLLNKKNIDLIIKETQLSQALIYRKLKELKLKNIIIKNNNYFSINKDIWLKLYEFIFELDKFENNISEKIPDGSIIYKNDNTKILFSNKNNLDLTKTAFSTFDKFGIKIGTISNYYTNIKEIDENIVLYDCITILKKEWSIQNLILTCLFFLKFQKKITFSDEILINLKKILNNESIENYPTRDEIIERAEIYNIEVK